ncbi:MAG: tetratricopeptide repeat protein [Janthinobacterium lividum]
MTRPTWLILTAALAVPAVVPAAASARATPAAVDSASHGYVLGRFAYADDRLDDAARYFDEARRQTPGDPVLMRRTFELALAAGDEKLSFDLARQLAAANVGDSTVALVRLAEALKRRDWKAADAARPALADAGYAAVVGPIVEAWTLQGRGETDAALAVLDPDKFTGFARSYVTEHRALLLSSARRWSEATPLYAGLLADEARGVTRLRVAAAQALQASGHAADAATLLTAGGNDPVLAAAQARLKSGRQVEPGTIEPRQGVGWLSARLAGDLSREKPVPLALIFARVATFLAPEAAENWMITGDVLARGGRPDAALLAYARIPSSDPMAAAAKAREAMVLSDAGRDADARRLLEAATAARTATADDWTRLGDFDRKALQYGAAAKAYDRAIALSGSTPAEVGWSLYFLRGGAYEQDGDWARAEPDLRTALALAPEEPAVLNYLGYALLDRGIKLPEAQTLIETAARLRPEDGFIADSLGWAYFRTGQFARAVTVLQNAVIAEPGDPTINEHLGDAFWRVGRQIEARFEWRAAIDLGATPAQVTTIRSKLDYGLDVAAALAQSSASKLAQSSAGKAPPGTRPPDPVESAPRP